MNFLEHPQPPFANEAIMSSKLFQLITVNHKKEFSDYLQRFVSNLRSKYRTFFKHSCNLKQAIGESFGTQAYEIMEYIANNPTEDFREEQIEYMRSTSNHENWELTNFPMIIIEALSCQFGQFDLADMEVL